MSETLLSLCDRSGRRLLFIFDSTAHTLDAYAIPSVAINLFEAWPQIKTLRELKLPVAWLGVLCSLFGLTDHLAHAYHKKDLRTARVSFRVINNAAVSFLFTFLAIVALYCDVVGESACMDVEGPIVAKLLIAPLMCAVAEIINGCFYSSESEHVMSDNRMGQLLRTIQNASILVEVSEILEWAVSYTAPSNLYKVLRFASCLVLGGLASYGKQINHAWSERLMHGASALAFGFKIWGTSQPLFWMLLGLGAGISLLTNYFCGLPDVGTRAHVNDPITDFTIITSDGSSKTLAVLPTSEHVSVMDASELASYPERNPLLSHPASALAEEPSWWNKLSGYLYSFWSSESPVHSGAGMETNIHSMR